MRELQCRFYCCCHTLSSAFVAPAWRARSSEIAAEMTTRLEEPFCSAHLTLCFLLSTATMSIQTETVFLLTTPIHVQWSMHIGQ